MIPKPEEVYENHPTDRFLRLRRCFLNDLKPTLEIDSTRSYTRVMMETEGEPMELRRGKAFAAVCREMRVVIAPDELIVGNTSVTRGGFKAEVEHITKFMSFLDSPARGCEISPEDEKELRDEIIPYWRGNGNWGKTPEGQLKTALRNSFFGLPDQWPYPAIEQAGGGYGVIDYGHQAVDYIGVVKKGILGYLEEARERMNSLDITDPEDLLKAPFIQGVIIALEAAAEVGTRFAAKAREMAKTEKDPQRKNDLKKIAEVCDQVPAHPARTFHQALQTCWFVFILQTWETPGTRGISFSRLDRELLEYYDNDITAGRLSKADAQELIDCFLMQIPQISWPYDDGHNYVAGDITVPHLSVGGLKENGSDATTPLSYAFIEGMMHVRLAEPNLSIAIHSKSPDLLLIKAAQLVSLGVGNPMFQNQDVITLGILARPQHGEKRVSIEEARVCSYVGCQEPFITGKDGVAVNTPYINTPLALELALNNGISRVTGQQVGPEQEDSKTFETYEDFEEAVKKQLKWLITTTVVTGNLRLKALGELRPTVFTSALLGCIKSGVARERGGCDYHWGPAVFATGLPDLADSLSAVKRVVFEERKLSMAEVVDAIADNFEGHDEIWSALSKAPKFGVGDEMADGMMASITDFFCRETLKQKNIFGGHPLPTVQALYTFILHGFFLGALPSGRKAHQSLSTGIGPCNNAVLESPITVFNSVGKVDTALPSDGQSLNIRLDPFLFKVPEEGWKTVVNLVRSAVDEKLFHVQFNVLDQDTLIKAQKEPEEYKDLTVRVAGFCAYFVTLPEILQDEIIKRAAMA